MGIEKTFRNAKEKIHARDLVEKYHETFDTVIVTFQGKVLPRLMENRLIEALPDIQMGSSHSKYPLYRVKDCLKTLFYLCPIGAPTAVGILEEIVYTFDVKNIVMYGSAGVLDHAITAGKVIVPTKAYRDEGTSYHYKAASDFIDIDHASTVIDVVKTLGVSYVSGVTWTTDGFYRETIPIIRERKAQGCIAVEMEISAVQAFASYRGLNLYTFVYGADNLDASQWEKRILGVVSDDARVNYFMLAVAIAKAL